MVIMGRVALWKWLLTRQLTFEVKRKAGSKVHVYSLSAYIYFLTPKTKTEISLMRAQSVK